MKRNWTKWLAVMLAGGMLMGCGSQPWNTSGIKPLRADREANGGEGAEGMAGLSDLPYGSETEDSGWDREDDGSYEMLRQFSHELMLENMEKENPLLSPVSAYLALGMVAMGARGRPCRSFRK